MSRAGLAGALILGVLHGHCVSRGDDLLCPLLVELEAPTSDDRAATGGDPAVVANIIPCPDVLATRRETAGPTAHRGIAVVRAVAIAAEPAILTVRHALRANAAIARRAGVECRPLVLDRPALLLVELEAPASDDRAAWLVRDVHVAPRHTVEVGPADVQDLSALGDEERREGRDLAAVVAIDHDARGFFGLLEQYRHGHRGEAGAPCDRHCLFDACVEIEGWGVLLRHVAVPRLVSLVCHCWTPSESLSLG